MTLSSKIALAFSALVAIAGSLAIAIVIEDQARVRRGEFRKDSVEMLELLALSIAPSVASGRHDRVQAVLDNVANYPDRMPDIEALEVVGRDGRVIADLDPRRFNEPAGDAAPDLRRAEPEAQEVPPDRLRVVVPIRLAYPLGVVRATFAETHLDAEVAGQQRRAAAMLAATLVVLALGLYIVHRRLVGRRIKLLAATARRLQRGSLETRAGL